MRKKISDGMIFEINSVNRNLHCKVIVSQIVSHNEFVNESSLIYLFDVSSGERNGQTVHNYGNLTDIKIVYPAQYLFKKLKFVGTEPLKKWEINMDIGIRSCFQGQFITQDDINIFEKDHEILKSDNKIMAIPFFDMKNNQLDHLPLFRIEEGFTTIDGLLREADKM